MGRGRNSRRRAWNRRGDENEGNPLPGRPDRASRRAVRAEGHPLRLHSGLIVAGSCRRDRSVLGVWYFFRIEERRPGRATRVALSAGARPVTPCRRDPRLEQIDRMAGRHERRRPSNSWRKVEGTCTVTGRPAEKGFVHIPIEQAMKPSPSNLPVRKRSPPAGRGAKAWSMRAIQLGPHVPRSSRHEANCEPSVCLSLCLAAWRSQAQAPTPRRLRPCCATWASTSGSTSRCRWT